MSLFQHTLGLDVVLQGQKPRESSRSTLPMSEKATLPAYWLSRPGAHEQCDGGPLLKSLGNFVHDEGVWLKCH